ncbi:hypothetical protein PUN28_014872 [Cardiocondyla obscurior]|uniref:Uncharacterized protein n=1 Tax=Cardiocondyla obscurior TaxID=286306 RepID=A0AAW2F0X6_9HYME
MLTQASEYLKHVSETDVHSHRELNKHCGEDKLRALTNFSTVSFQLAMLERLDVLRDVILHNLHRSGDYFRHSHASPVAFLRGAVYFARLGLLSSTLGAALKISFDYFLIPS